MTTIPPTRPPGMLTPIRNRGRRKKPWSPSDGVPKPIASGPKGGRPMLSPEEKAARSKAGSNKRARLLVAKPPPRRKQRKTLSRLEALPVELIEKIFFYSLNVNLPRCSRSLAEAVSSERVYRALTLLAFWDDSASAGSSKGSDATAGPTATAAAKEILRLLRPLDYVPLHQNERRSLQASVLRCRWCTIERLLSHLPDLMRLTVQRHWLNAGITMTSEQQESLRLFLAQKQDTRTFEGTDENSNPYTLSITPLVSITITCMKTEEKTTHRIFGILEIPDTLISGTDEGFSPTHTRFLEILRVASGFNNSDLTTPPPSESRIRLSHEALQHGIHTALIEHNADALTTLLKIDEYIYRCENTSTAATTQNLPYTIPAENFRTAVRVARNNPTFFQLLLRANAESIPADDPEITAWAVELNDPFGAWLLDFMLQLPRQIEAARQDPVHAAVFYMGRANAQISMARRYLEEVLGVQEMGGWMEEVSVDVSQEWVKT